jgi:hypothetical protein
VPYISVCSEFVVVDDDDDKNTVTENFTLEQAMTGSISIAVIFLYPRR